MKRDYDFIPRLVYDGSTNAYVYTYTSEELVTGGTYLFYLAAVNFNGEGELSDPAVFTVCTAPSGLKPPTVTATTDTIMDLVWTSPADDGGCPLIGYELYLDDGSGSGF